MAVSERPNPDDEHAYLREVGFRRLLAKLEVRGHKGLSPAQRLAVNEIIRQANRNHHPALKKAAQEIMRASLEYRFSLQLDET